MKKVFALVLALVLVLASGLAMAEAGGASGDLTGTSGDLTVDASYQAEDVTLVTIQWTGDFAGFEYTWNTTSHAWVLKEGSDTSKTVTFSIENHGAGTKNIKLEATVADDLKDFIAVTQMAACNVNGFLVGNKIGVGSLGLTATAESTVGGGKGSVDGLAAAVSVTVTIAAPVTEGE